MSDIVFELHELFNGLRRHSFPFNQNLKDIPKNGIYIKFERGEKYNALDRIVRIGTDKGDDQLHSRLFQHFEDENQRRSIFRKSIGRCILNKENPDYLKYWNLDITSKIDKEKNLKYVDLQYEQEIEGKISRYIQSNFSFCVFKVDSKEDRLFWETKSIATIGQGKIKPSLNWLGNSSPTNKIRMSGLWQVQGLSRPKLTDGEFGQLKKMV